MPRPLPRLGAASLLFPTRHSLRAAGAEAPCLAAGLADGRLLFLGADGGMLAAYRSKAAPLSLAWDGAVLYGLDASGEAFALAARGQGPLVRADGLPKGRLYLFAERLVAVGRGRAVSLSVGGEVFRELSDSRRRGDARDLARGPRLLLGLGLGPRRLSLREAPWAPRGLPALPAYPPLPDIVSRTLLFDPFAADPDDQLTRLADIENSLRSGTIGKDEPEAAAYCAAVATRALDRDLSEAERRRGGNPLPRSRACYLLGDLGSPAYREPLFRRPRGGRRPGRAGVGLRGPRRSSASTRTAARCRPSWPRRRGRSTRGPPSSSSPP